MHAALDECGGVGVGDVVGELPAQRARAELAGAADHVAGDDPGALGVELVALAEAGDQPALPSACVSASLRKPGLASPDSTSAPSAPSGVSWATPSSSKSPTAIVSAPVPGGASVVARTSMQGANTRVSAMPNTVILSAARTPVGKLGGGLSSLPATKLGGIAIKAALERAAVEPDQVQHVVMGQVLQAGQGQIPSRQAQIEAGIPKEVTSETINKVCASGVRAAGILDAAIRAGDVEVAVAGGMESMSNAPYLLPKARFGMRMGDAKVLDAMVQDGLRNPFSGKQMFEEATEVGDELEMTRADMDRWALRSHERTIAATDDGRLPEEIVAGDGLVAEGRHRGRGRRGAAARHHARAAREAARA